MSDSEIPKWYLKNDEGDPSLSASLVVYTFILTVFLVIGSAVLRAMGLPTEDMTAIVASFLIPVLGSYNLRKHTDRKFDSEDKKTIADAAKTNGQ